MASHAAEPTDTSRRTIGLWIATALVVGNMIGSGCSCSRASLASYGGISLVGLGVHRRGLHAFWRSVFARLGRRSRAPAARTPYSRRAFGDFVGFQTAWGVLDAVWAGNAAIAVAFVSYLGHFLAVRARRDHVLAGRRGRPGHLVSHLGQRCRASARAAAVQAVTTVLKLVPLVAIAFVGLLSFRRRQLRRRSTPPAARAYTALTAAAALTLWAFIGLESATVPAENVRRPRAHDPTRPR